MIDPVLKKFGLSEARRSVRYLNNPTTYSRTPIKTKHTTQRKFNETQPTVYRNQAYVPAVRPFAATHKSRGTNTLQRLTNYLQSQYNGVCPNHSHLQNKVKFICLNEACSNNFGCAECFLYKHSDHSKAQIGTCIRELQQLDLFMGQSYQMIFSQKNQIKQQFIKNIEIEIDHMCDEFHRNLQFLKNKALQQIDQHLFSKYEGLQALNNYRSHKSNQLQSESKLISELMKIDIKGIEKDLNFQLKELNFQKLNYQPVVKYFEQMNGALGNFMAQFKKCFPKIYSYSSDAKMSNSKSVERSNFNNNTFSDVRSNELQNTIKLSQNNSVIN